MTNKKKLVSKVHLFLIEANQKGPVRALGYAVLGDEFLRISCKIMENKNGIFVGLPGRMGTDKKDPNAKRWFSDVWFFKEETRKEFDEAVIAEYNAMIAAKPSVSAKTKTAPTAQSVESAPEDLEPAHEGDNYPF